jgi:hypothetical protein
MTKLGSNIQKKEELKQTLQDMNAHIKELGNKKPSEYGRVNQAWDEFTKVAVSDEMVSLEDALKGMSALGKFVVDSIPHVITIISEDKTRNDIIAGKLDREGAIKRALGKDAQSFLSAKLIQSALSLGSNPNNSFSGDLFTIAVGINPGTSAVEFAIRNNHYNSVKTLLESKGDTNYLSHGSAPIHNAFGGYNRYLHREANEDILKEYLELNRKLIQDFVIEKTKDINIQNDLGENVLHVIARNNEPTPKETIDEIVKKKVDVNHKDMQGDTPLHVAANVGNSNFLRNVKGLGMDPNGKNNAGQTPLHLAALADEADCFEKLLALGADPHKKDLRGKTPFYYFENDKQILKYRVVKSPEDQKLKMEKKKEFLEKYREKLGVDKQAGRQLTSR